MMFTKKQNTKLDADPRSNTGSTPTHTPSPEATAHPDHDAPASKSKMRASIISPDLTITADLNTTGEIHIEGTVEGDIRAQLLTVGERAVIKGEIIADNIVIMGRVMGHARALKLRLCETARVECDIIHKIIAIKSGAHFEGSVQRQDDPLNVGAPKSGSDRSAISASAYQTPPVKPAPPVKAKDK